MARLITVTAVTGISFAVFAGGAAVPTIVEWGINSVGPDIHLFPSPTVDRVQHVGWIGLGLNQGPGTSYLDNPLVKVVWWTWLDFVWQLVNVPAELAVTPVDTLLWQINVGNTVTISVEN